MFKNPKFSSTETPSFNTLYRQLSFQKFFALELHKTSKHCKNCWAVFQAAINSAAIFNSWKIDELALNNNHSLTHSLTIKQLYVQFRKIFFLFTTFIDANYYDFSVIFLNFGPKLLCFGQQSTCYGFRLLPARNCSPFKYHCDHLDASLSVKIA
jgi:hypothetical protein